VHDEGGQALERGARLLSWIKQSSELLSALAQVGAPPFMDEPLQTAQRSSSEP
jgi:hypothetical protein